MLSQSNDSERSTARGEQAEGLGGVRARSTGSACLFGLQTAVLKMAKDFTLIFSNITSNRI